MRQLKECKAYFQRVFMDYLESKDKATTDRLYIRSIAKFEGLCETLKHIYGAEYVSIVLQWEQEAINAFYAGGNPDNS